VEAADAAHCAALARTLETRFRAAGAPEVVLALDAETERTMWELRHAASPILSRLDPSLRSMQFIEDGCVPPERLAEYVRGVRAALDRQGIRGVIFGHAGDAHVHVNPLVDLRDTRWRERVDALLDEVTALAARLGGTLSGEHGDGRLRAPLLSRVWSAETLARFAAVKRAFDPDGLLNPGAKIAAAGARAVERVKYDPSLAPLAGEARQVLARVERERAYARPRLELLGEAELEAEHRASALDASAGAA
jgi:FAD/FMN-containing dehydrogenase